MKLEHMQTEQRNNDTMQLDAMSVREALEAMNKEDQTVATEVQKTIPEIEALVVKAIKRLKTGGRLIYMGAGTSGRLGVLDAAECPPTFGVPPERVIGLIAGGGSAFTEAVEGAEDSKLYGKKDLAAIDLTANDTVIGIAASGRTPYVIGGLAYAREVGALTASISCNHDAPMSQHADIAIEMNTGPEVLTGSTRLKAGTAQKLILNMISTTIMVGLGKVFQNLMVDFMATNEKLQARGRHIIAQATGLSLEEADVYHQKANGQVKVAIVMILADASYDEAVTRLESSDGIVRKAIAQ
ncbi:N-acetylmuramic acid 6-phosphate etherase [Aureibacillus halotolerans]|uniref:N-acetylmuramic acid 6-phosphate etherase n=1 Tax=Aureibacillus halotolerans TaxID=1508390 RepID=A0A4R6UAR4_9BACI|nr:N-acetylmuramic acid 6-phosphate etherase [Aureibacillus halotolerans]TDQ42982.1 N-acetylmuramic acid 6-phosphate etherase [Aureibacillus halotolerans]